MCRQQPQEDSVQSCNLERHCGEVEKKQVSRSRDPGPPSSAPLYDANSQFTRLSSFMWPRLFTTFIANVGPHNFSDCTHVPCGALFVEARARQRQRGRPSTSIRNISRAVSDIRHRPFSRDNPLRFGYGFRTHVPQNDPRYESNVQQRIAWRRSTNVVAHAAPNMTGCFFNCTAKSDHSRIDLAKNLDVSISEGCATEARRIENYKVYP